MRFSERDTDEDDQEEEERGRQMLGFLFGNVDDSGDLDEEYLDQDAKEHLSELAQQLGSSWVDIEQVYAKRKKLTDVSGGEEHEEYDEKAEDAVDYEDIQEHYEGPEVQLDQLDMQFYADAALAAPIKLAEEDNYDEDEDSDSEQSAESKLESPVKNASEPEDEAHLSQDDDEEVVPIVQEQCLTSAVDTIASDDEDEKEEDWDQVLGSQETTSSSKEQEEEITKVSLPVLCQEDGKPVFRFSELFEVREPYWVIGRRKGRQKRGHTTEKRDRAEEDPEAMDDDEEVVCMRPSQQPVLTADSVNAERDFEGESSSEGYQVGSGIEEDGIRTAPILSHTRRNRIKHRKLVFTAAEPMKVDSDLYESHIAESRRHIPDANFDLIHQVEWEDSILWDISKRDESISGHRASCELVEVDSESEQSDLSDIDYERLSTDQLDAGLSDYPDWQRPCVVEPLCQRNSDLEVEKELTTSAKTLRHPQILRLETRSFDKQPDEEGRAELLKRISNMALEVKEKNQELARGDWLSSISWGELEPSLPRSKVIFDLMDPQMVFETSEAKNDQSICLHAAAVVLTPGGTEGAPDGAERISLSVTRFNISNDKYYTNKNTHQQQKSNAKKRGIYGVKVMHSIPAIKLQSMKPKLSKKDLANFHRPKAVWYPHHNEVAAKAQGRLSARGPMKVIVKTLGGKRNKFIVDASETLNVLKAKTAKKLGDLKPSEETKVFYSGKKLVDGFTFAQQQVPPNSVLHLVRTKIYPWPKAQRLPGENKPLQPPGAFKKKSELSVKDGHVALMEYCEERPLLLGNVGMGGRLCTYYRKQSPTDATAATLRAERGPWVGISLPLEPTEDSPFLGDIRPGETQSSLETNMYRAPVFPHKVATTDFLLVRSPKGKLSLRRIDSVHVVGQQEPHMDVLAPTSKSVQNYLGNRLMVYMYREFREKEKPGVKLPHVRADDVMSQFPSLTEGFIRKRLRPCADLQNIGGEMCWVMRRNFRIPSEEEIRRSVTPENVCRYESMQAGLHHLKRMGIHKLTQPSGLAAAMNQLPDDAITIAAASHIERQLQITPWNLSNNFVEATVQGRGSLERLEIVGAGDPSGQGLGFSYLRIATKPNVEKKAAAARGGGAVTGTDADLRRLGLEAAGKVLLKFNVSEETINKLSRWERIGMVRNLSSKQAASGDKSGAPVLNKFARGQRMSFLQLQQQTREKCQDIWDRQVQSLSMAEGDDSESDGEAVGDLDSFAYDLENILEANEGDDGGGPQGKREGMGGLGARRRRQIAQEEEDLEGEEAEAAEFMRIFGEDDEAEMEQKKKRKKSVPASQEKESKKVEKPLDLVLPTPQQESVTTAHPGVGDGRARKEDRLVVRMVQRIIRTWQPDGSYTDEARLHMLKRIIRTLNPDGSYTDEAILITDPNEVALYLAKNADKEDTAKKGRGKISLSIKKLKKSGAPMKEISTKGKANGKFGRDALSMVCGTCGQLGHMKTNKTCPLYNEEDQRVAWQDSGTAANGLLERQGTKIIIKRNSILTKEMEELRSSKSEQPTAIKKTLPKEEIPPPVPFLKMPSLRMKVKVSGTNQNSASYPAPSLWKPPRERIEKLHGVHANGTAETGVSQTPWPLFKLESSNQKQKGQGVKRLKHDQDAETAMKEKERIRKRERKEREAHVERERKEREAYEEDVLIEEREKEETDEREREREWKEREETELNRKATLLRANGAESSRGNKGENKSVFVNKIIKKKIVRAQDDLELLGGRERELEQVECVDREYQRVLDNEQKREQEELDRIEVRERAEQEETLREEQESHRQHMKEKEKRREQHRHCEEAIVREAELEAQRAAQEKEEKERRANKEEEQQRHKERILLKHRKIKHMKERTRVLSGPPSGPSGERDRGKGIKRRPDTPPPSYHHTADFGNAPKRLRKTEGEVDLCNILEGVVETLRSADCSYLFLKPVPKREAPDYLHYVKRPMDLSTIRDRIRKLKYRSRDDFRNDVLQIADNAHLYNDGRNPGIPPLADRLLKLCDEELIARGEDLDEAEAGIEPFDNDLKRQLS